MRRASRLALALSLVVPMALADTLPALLDTPALPSSVAARQPLSGIARAGTRLVAVGRHGIIVYSDDSGENWRQAAVPVSADLTAVTFVSADRGWAVGHLGVILATRDGGASWTRQLDGNRVGADLNAYAAEQKSRGADAKLVGEISRLAEAGLDQSFLDVAFDNERDGYAVGSFNLIYHTEDAGEKWSPVLARTDNPRFLHLYAIRKLGSDIYIAGEQGVVLKLDRAAERFIARPSPYAGSYFGIVGNGQAILAFGLRGNAWRSTDSGATWQHVDAGPEVGITAATVLADGRWVLADLAGIALISSDSGANFKPALSAPTPFAGVVQVDGGKLALVGMRGVTVQTLQ